MNGEDIYEKGYKQGYRDAVSVLRNTTTLQKELRGVAASEAFVNSLAKELLEALAEEILKDTTYNEGLVMSDEMNQEKLLQPIEFCGFKVFPQKYTAALEGDKTAILCARDCLRSLVHFGHFSLVPTIPEDDKEIEIINDPRPNLFTGCLVCKVTWIDFCDELGVEKLLVSFEVVANPNFIVGFKTTKEDLELIVKAESFL